MGDKVKVAKQHNKKYRSESHAKKTHHKEYQNQYQTQSQSQSQSQSQRQNQYQYQQQSQSGGQFQYQRQSQQLKTQHQSQQQYQYQHQTQNEPIRDGQIYHKNFMTKLYEVNKTIKNPINVSVIEKAIIDTQKWHGEQKRQTGEPYYSHPIEVAMYTLEHEPTVNTLIAALFHDLLEDTKVTEKEIISTYGREVMSYVKDLTRKSPVANISAVESMFLLIAKSKINLLVVKVLDRLQNRWKRGLNYSFVAGL